MKGNPETTPEFESNREGKFGFLMAQYNGQESHFSLRETISWIFNHTQHMTQFGRKIIKSKIRRTIQRRISVVRPCLLRLLRHFPSCYGKNRYRMLSLPEPPYSPPCTEAPPPPESDLVALKISLLGDSHIGKTSFLVKYVGDENEEKWKQREGVNQMDKTLVVGGARLSYSIWEVAGDGKSEEQIPLACKDSVAILIMFDLTSRCTLNSVLGWYREARKWNKSAIPVLIGTKFDDFIQLPTHLQWTIASQARAYAKALHATLFFSSATYNINVNKIFKFITAKLFDLPWTVERNLTVGEPIIDF